MDLNAPFLHEFTYQAMCNDLLDVEDGQRYRCAASRSHVRALAQGLTSTTGWGRRYIFTNEQGQQEEREAILSDDDKVWCEVRHMHMKDALDKLIADFKSYAGEHGGTFGGAG